MFDRHYCYLMVKAKNREHVTTLIQTLNHHPRRATHPHRAHGAIEGVQLQISYKDEKDLEKTLESIRKDGSCDGIHHQYTYSAHMTSEMKEALIASIVFSSEIYAASFVGLIAVNHNNLVVLPKELVFQLIDDIIFSSIVPALAAFLLNLRERLRSRE